MDVDDGLILRVEQNGHGAVVHVEGEIDLVTAPQLRTFLKALDGTVAIDLRDVAFLDSTGIGVLVGARNRLSAVGGGLVLFNPNSVVARTLEVVGLRDWIEQ